VPAGAGGFFKERLSIKANKNLLNKNTMTKKILLLALLGVLVMPLQAQRAVSFRSSYAPEAGNYQVNLLLGKGFFYTADGVLLIRQNAEAVGEGLTSDLPAYLTLSDPNSNSLVNMIGVEAKYFITDQIAVSLSGAGYINNTPWREAADPVVTNDITILPKYVNIDAQLKTRIVANVGGQYYFSVGNERIHPYAGIIGTFQFASLSAQSTYAGFDDASLEADKRDAGVRTGQLFGWAASAIAGIEYSLLPGLVVGFEIKPFSYYYSGLSLFAQPGLDAMTGENQDCTIFAQPVFKIGFRF
jgi:outer membrane protein W